MREMITNASQYRLAIVTALPKEFAAVETMLDQHDDITVPDDSVRYTVGRIGHHQVVVTLLPKMGNNLASAVSSNLLRSFPNVGDILMVGIAGGVPDPKNPENHVRLGDMVISTDEGVVQFDFGKLEQIGHEGETPREHFTIRASDPPPSARLQQAVRFLEARRIRKERPWERHIERSTALENAVRPPSTKDVLYDSRDPGRIIPHPRDAMRIAGQPKLHYGVIGSSNMLLKEPLLRDRLRDEYQVRAIEMEGSGIASATWMSGNAGYLLIRGICDYCDSHKNDLWQGYAAVVAAAYARALIESIPADATRPQSDVQHNKPGERSISIGGNVSGSTIISGDHNTVS
jgi:nucleoside phosphorylase